MKEKGFIVLLWNERQLDSTAFLRDYERFLVEYGTDYQTVRHENISDQILRDFFQTDYKQKSFLNIQTLDFDGLKGRMLSSSYMPTEEDARFQQVLENLKSLFAEHAESGKIEIRYDTNVFYAQV